MVHQKEKAWIESKTKKAEEVCVRQERKRDDDVDDYENEKME